MLRIYLQIISPILFLVLIFFESGNAQPVYVLDKSRFQQGDWLNAEESLKHQVAMFEIHPDRPTWIWQLSRIYLQQNRFNEAKKYLQILEQEGSSIQQATAAFWIAWIEFQYGQYESAKKRLSPLQYGVDFPFYSESMVLYGVLLLYEKKWEQCRSVLSQVTDEFPQSPQYLYARSIIAESYFLEGDYDKSISSFHQLIPILDEPLKSLSGLILAESYLKNGDYKNSVIWYGRLKAKSSQYLFSDLVLYRLATALFKNGQKDRAEAFVDQIPLTSAYSAYANILKTEILKEAGRLKELSELTVQYSDADSRIYDYYLQNRLWASFLAGNWQSSQNLISQQVGFNQVHFRMDSLLLSMADQYALRHELTSAISVLELLEKIYNTNETPLPESILYRLANFHFRQSDYEMAADYAGRVLRQPGSVYREDCYLIYLSAQLYNHAPDSILRAINSYQIDFPTRTEETEWVKTITYFLYIDQQNGYQQLQRGIRLAINDSLQANLNRLAVYLYTDIYRTDLGLSHLRIIERLYPDFFDKEMKLLSLLNQSVEISWVFTEQLLEDYLIQYNQYGSHIIERFKLKYFHSLNEKLKQEFLNKLFESQNYSGLLNIWNRYPQSESQISDLFNSGQPKLAITDDKQLEWQMMLNLLAIPSNDYPDFVKDAILNAVQNGNTEFAENLLVKCVLDNQIDLIKNLSDRYLVYPEAIIGFMSSSSYEDNWVKTNQQADWLQQNTEFVRSTQEKFFIYFHLANFYNNENDRQLALLYFSKANDLKVLMPDNLKSIKGEILNGLSFLAEQDMTDRIKTITNHLTESEKIKVLTEIIDLVSFSLDQKQYDRLGTNLIAINKDLAEVVAYFRLRVQSKTMTRGRLNRAWIQFKKQFPQSGLIENGIPSK